MNTALISADIAFDAPLVGIYHFLSQSGALVDGTTGLVAASISSKQEREICTGTHVHCALAPTSA